MTLIGRVCIEKLHTNQVFQKVLLIELYVVVVVVVVVNNKKNVFVIDNFIIRKREKSFKAVSNLDNYNYIALQRRFTYLLFQNVFLPNRTFDNNANLSMHKYDEYVLNQNELLTSIHVDNFSSILI